MIPFVVVVSLLENFGRTVTSVTDLPWIICDYQT
jgi:hypothetical protein